MSRYRDQQGLTLVELLVVIAVSGIMMTAITAFALNYWSSVSVVQSDENSLVTRLNIGDNLRNKINSASDMISQNDLADAHVGNVDPSDVSGTHWLPIHAIPTTIPVGAAGTITPVIYFNRPSIDTSKNVIMIGATPYHDNVILFLNGTGKQLISRVIANTSAPANSARTSCPTGFVSGACPQDVVVATDVASITTRYFSKSGNLIDYTSIVDASTGNYIGPDFPAVEVVEFTIKLSIKAQLHNASTTSNQTVVRVALRN